MILPTEGRIDLLLRHQTFIAGSVSEAERLVSSSPDESLQRVKLEFGQIQDAMDGEVSVEDLKEAKVFERLQRVVTLAPNHASAAILLRTAEGNLPDTFSSRGALRVLGQVIRSWGEVTSVIESPADFQGRGELKRRTEKWRKRLRNCERTCPPGLALSVMTRSS